MPRGGYSRERRLAGAKCDVPARLFDGRLLALECKVSNGPKNGWKRVNREVGGKSDAWRAHFGTQALTGVILAGVFDLSCLVTAQDRGVVILWEHDLEPAPGVRRINLGLNGFQRSAEPSRRPPRPTRVPTRGPAPNRRRAEPGRSPGRARCSLRSWPPRSRSLRFGLVECRGQPCQKQPSTKTATLARRKTMSASRRRAGSGR